MRPWKDCADLLALFSVNNGVGACRFADLCELGALLRAAGTGQYGLGDLERAMMKEYRISPLLFWSVQKQAVRPLLAAGGDTLRALGVKVDGDPTTVHQLAAGIVAVMAEDYARDLDQIFDIARDLENRLAELGI